ncbi:MAG TPA: hypothetical protein VFQ68_38175, partial [Streptosporangiaceae bacterium]|nr:hypothetical protein [Streptosporangiaceae bacterium]
VPCPTRDTSGAIEAMALYAGESAGAVTQVMPAADVVRELAEGAERLLSAALPSVLLQEPEYRTRLPQRRRPAGRAACRAGPVTASGSRGCGALA